MESISYEHIVEEIFTSNLLQRSTCEKYKNIVDRNSNIFSDGTPYILKNWWFVAEHIITTSFKGKNIVIKIGTNPKLLLDAEREIFVWWLIPGIAPCILEKWEKIFPTGNKYWVIQAYIPGELWSDYLKSRRLTDEHKIQLARTLEKLHQISQTWESYFGRAGPWARKKYKTFSDYISHFREYITNSDHFSHETTVRLLGGIAFFEQKLSWKVHVPCLIHGDFQDRNILISDNKNCALIDFWDTKWSLKEAEFATMLSHISEEGIRKEFYTIIKIYESIFWDLDVDLLNLFLLCCGSYKIIQRRENYTQDWSMWNTILLPILNSVSKNR